MQASENETRKQGCNAICRRWAPFTPVFSIAPVTQQVALHKQRTHPRRHELLPEHSGADGAAGRGSADDIGAPGVLGWLQVRQAADCAARGPDPPPRPASAAATWQLCESAGLGHPCCTSRRCAEM